MLCIIRHHKASSATLAAPNSGCYLFHQGHKGLWQFWCHMREQLRLSCVCMRADDYAPPGAKSKWLAAFYLCIPVGYALVRTICPAFQQYECLESLKYSAAAD